MEPMSRTVIVLAAGEGKRMKSALPKVLHTLLGRSLVGHVLAAAAPLSAQRTLVVVGVVAEQGGLGRIVTGADGAFERIVEERDATPAQRAIREINAGAYAFDAALLRDALGKLSTDNDQGEEYLTDVLGLLVAAGHGVGVHRAEDPDEALGANDRAQLAQLRAL